MWYILTLTSSCLGSLEHSQLHATSFISQNATAPLSCAYELASLAHSSQSGNNNIAVQVVLVGRRRYEHTQSIILPGCKGIKFPNMLGALEMMLGIIKSQM